MASEESIYHLMKGLCSCHLVKNKFQIGQTRLIKKQLLKSYEVLLEHESKPELFTILEKLYSYIEKLRTTNNSPTASKLDVALEKFFHLGLDDGLVKNLLHLLLKLSNSSKKPAKDATLCHFPILTLNKFETTVDEGFNEDSPTGSVRDDDDAGRQEKEEDDGDVWEHLHLKNQQIITYSSWDSSKKFMKPSELPYITDLIPSIHPPMTSQLLTSSNLKHPSIHQSIHQSILLKSLGHVACTSSSSFIQDVVKLFTGLPSHTFNISNNEFHLNPKNVNSCVCNSEFLKELIHIGNSALTLTQFINEHQLDTGTSFTDIFVYFSNPDSYLQPLIQCLQSYLHMQRCLLTCVQWNHQRSLLHVVLKFKQIFKQLRFLSLLCSDIKSCQNTGQLLTCLYEEWMEADDNMRPLIFFLFKSSSIRYFKCLERWIYEGELDIYSGHFMVTHNQKYINKRDELFWKHAFQLLPASDMPKFLRDYSALIINCGKSVHLLKLCCNKYMGYFNSCSKPEVKIVLCKTDMKLHRKQCDDYLRNALKFFSSSSSNNKQEFDGAVFKQVADNKISSSSQQQINSHTKYEPNLNFELDKKMFSQVQMCRVADLLKSSSPPPSSPLSSSQSLPSSSSPSTEFIEMGYDDMHQLLEEGLINCIRIQSHLLNHTLLNYFTDIGIADYYEILRKFVLLQDDHFSVTLVGSLNKHLELVHDSKQHNPHFIFSSSVLNEILQHSLSSVEQQTRNFHLTDLLTFTFDYQSDRLIPKNEMLNRLGMTMKIDWPVNIIFQQKHLDSYSVLFQFFFKLKHVMWSLNDIHLTLKKVFKMSDNHKSHEVRQLLFYWHNMQHFVRAIQEYVTNQVMLVSWHEFQQKLNSLSHKEDRDPEIESVDQLIDEGSTFLNRCLSQCLLNKQSSAVYAIIQNLFNIILIFHSQLKFHECDNLTTKLCFNENFQKFHDGCVFLYKVIVKLEQKTHQTHLQDLRLRINFNDFY